MSRKARRQITKTIIGNLDSLYNALVHTAAEFESKELPIESVELAIGQIVMPKDIPELEQLRKDYKKMLEALKDACIDYGEKFKTKMIPVTIVREYIRILKVGYLKSVKKRKNY